MMIPQPLTPLEKRCLYVIRWRLGRSNPVSYRELAVLLDAPPRAVRSAVERLVTEFRYPICSSYDPRRPGYYWPVCPEEIADTCRRLLQHGVAIIQRARAIGKASAEEIFGQLRIIFDDEEVKGSGESGTKDQARGRAAPHPAKPRRVCGGDRRDRQAPAGKDPDRDRHE